MNYASVQLPITNRSKAQSIRGSLAWLNGLACAAKGPVSKKYNIFSFEKKYRLYGGKLARAGRESVWRTEGSIYSHLRGLEFSMQTLKPELSG